MRLVPNQDVGSGLLFLLLGGAFGWGARAHDLGSAAAPGPGYLPLGLSVALGLIGLALLLRGLLRPGAALPRVAVRPLLAVLGGVLLFAVLLPRGGLVVALPPLVVATALARPGARWREVALTAVLLTAACGVIFIHGLGVNIHWWG